MHYFIKKIKKNTEKKKKNTFFTEKILKFFKKFII